MSRSADTRGIPFDTTSVPASAYAPSAKSGRYQELEVLSATPGRLVVLVYDHLLGALARVRIAIDAGAPEPRIEALTQAREAVGELMATLDHERGGGIATQLASLYTFFLAELAELGRSPRAEVLDRLVAMVSELRDAFAVAERGVSV